MTLPPISAENIFRIGSLPITNTYINSSIAVIFFVVLAYLIKRNVRTVPKGIQNFFEALMELMLGYIDQVTGSRQKSLKYLPIVGSLFLFILANNWIGDLPGIGSIGFWHFASNHAEFIPLLRSADSDVNLTLAMATFGIIASHIIGVGVIGFFRYLGKFIKVGDIYKSFKSLNPIKIFTAFIEFGVGLIEIISEVAKFISLSLRLFGNVFAGEVLLTVLASLVALFIPLPFIGLELLVGFIQSLVFSMLVLVYIATAIMPTAPEHGHEELHAQNKPKHQTQTIAQS